MGHEITGTDNMFSVREPTWHGLGIVLKDYPTREEAQRLAHPWEPQTEPLYRVVESRHHTIPSFSMDDCGGYVETCMYDDHWFTKSRAVRVPDFDLVVRDDNGAALGVKPSTRELVSNTEMYDIAEAIEQSGKGAANPVQFETAGSLQGGRKVWLLLRLREPLLLPGDPNGATLPYYALQNAHDGLGAFRGQVTMVRIVCANTSQVADMDAQTRGTEFVFRHTRNVRDRIQEAQVALAGWRESLESWRLVNEHLLDLRITQYQREIYLREFVPEPPAKLVSDRVMANIEQARVAIAAILDGPTCEGISETAYGLVQASVEYAEHYRRARSTESRFRRAFLERSVLVADSRRLAEQVAVGSGL